MKIAPGVDREEWLNLNLDEHDSPDWEKAIEIFKKRIDSRYIEPVDILIDKDEERDEPLDRRYGFTVLAIDCFLIETLQAFKEGLINTRNKSEKMFVSFLTKTHGFSKYFKSDNEARRFYKEIRCGILHQAEVRGNWRVWSEGDLRGHTGRYEYINRTEVHKNLKMH